MHKWKWEGHRYEYFMGVEWHPVLEDMDSLKRQGMSTRVTHCSGIDRAVTMSVLQDILAGRGIRLVHAEMVAPLRWPRGLGYALALILACGLSVLFPWWIGASLLTALLLLQERP